MAISYYESESIAVERKDTAASDEKSKGRAPGTPAKIIFSLLLLFAGGTTFAIHWYQTSDVRMGLTKEGCDIMASGSYPVPTIPTDKNGKCYVEHADISLNSLFDEYMYHVNTRDGEHEFWIKRTLVEWIEKNGSRRYTAGK